MSVSPLLSSEMPRSGVVCGENEVEGVAVKTCPVDSTTEDGSVDSTGQSPKGVYPPPFSIVEYPDRHGSRGLLSNKRSSSYTPRKPSRPSLRTTRPAGGGVSPDPRSGGSTTASDRSPGLPPQDPRHSIETTTSHAEHSSSPSPPASTNVDDTSTGAISPCERTTVPTLVGQPTALKEERKDEATETAQPTVPPFLLDEELTCCICLEPYGAENPMFRGECAHHFHLPCLLSWKQRSNSCPMCCAETLHGVGDLEDDRAPQSLSPSPARPHDASSESTPNVADDEEIAMALQRKYLRRAKRKTETRRLMRAEPAEPPLQNQTEQAHSNRTSPQSLGPVPAAGGPTPPSMALPRSDPMPQRTVRAPRMHPMPVAADTAGQTQSRTTRRGKHPKGKAECAIM